MGASKTASRIANLAYLIILIACVLATVFIFGRYANDRAVAENGIQAQVQDGSYRFTTEGCSFSVNFPAKPLVRQVMSGSIVAPEAELQTSDSILRANCIVGPNSFIADPNLLRSSVQAFLTQNGMDNVEVEIASTPYGVVATGRGFKTIQGQGATYATAWYVTNGSAMSLSVGAASNRYPTADVSAFLSSVITP